MKKLILCLLVLLTIHSQRAFSLTRFQDFSFDQKGIVFSIDPRIELYNVMNMLAGIPTITANATAYKQEIFGRFSAYEQHPGLQFFIRCRMKGWGVDNPLFFMLQLDKTLQLQPGIDPGVAKGAGGIDTIKQLAIAVKQFCEDSYFAEFFNAHAPFYRMILQNTQYHFRDFNERTRLEQYYGQQHAGYNIILNLLEGEGNFGPSVQTPEGRQLYAVISTNGSQGDLPSFTPSFSTYDLIYHEFSHSFINYLVHAADVAPTEHLWEPIKQSMAQQAYDNWLTVVQEHLVRAATIRLATQRFGEAIAQSYYHKMEIGRRFIYIDALCNRLQQYEQQRQRYPHFSNFFPHILPCLDSITQQDIARLQALVQQYRQPDVAHIPIPAQVHYDSSMVFIISSHENDETAMAGLKAYVEQYRNMVNSRINIITDNEALKTDLSHCDIMVFGTPHGNTFLRQHMAGMPLQITDSTVLAGNLLHGRHFQVVTTWVNPANPAHTMLIHTAQQAADIRNYFYSAQKEAHNYWIAENLVTIKSGDYRRMMQIWFADE
ncbi:DUF4932 domain-containing protein [Chitinophaga agrisoli]|uniref:DUF4932 domain-containing protein n=1 Tax=Chitinophaga agrisoli TaxID=2607653 RepID=A0A5B2VYQ9_9BACT|nr:DUF4932 domain-containing protein [Chitinophaga agrisoli]KAA2243788.1 DUF4932 domain-containing protein [Chitinophaga agrisoli]